VSRGLWFVTGAATGIYALVKVRRTARELTPDGVGARIAALRAGATVFADSVAKGMAEREADLCAQLERSPTFPRLIGAATSTPPPVGTGTSVPTTEPEGTSDGDR
jgi:Family of unknown function (DUF6167)